MASSYRSRFMSITFTINVIIIMIMTAIITPLLPLQTNAHALQQIAGPITLEMKPGESKTFQWGLLSDSERPINVSLSSEGIGSEFLSFPQIVSLPPGEVTYVTLNVRIPFDHPGAVELKPSLLATQAGEEVGQTVINIVMKKVPSIILATNENPKFRELTVKSYPQKVMIDGNEVEILIESSSQISNFTIDRENNIIAFNASGYGGTNGTTMSYINKLLEGPYTLTLNGTAITNVDTVTHGVTGEEGIKITYPHSPQNTIEITGGSVVVPADFQSINGTNSSSTVIGNAQSNNSSSRE